MPLAILRAALILLIAAVPLAAQDPGCTRFRPRVEKMQFEGNKSIRSFDLQQILYTERAGKLRRWFGWNVGPTACLDTLELRRDERRIAAWYAMRGYPGTLATVSIQKPTSRTAHVRFTVREAPPVVIDTLRVVGVPRGLVDQGRARAEPARRTARRFGARGHDGFRAADPARGGIRTGAPTDQASAGGQRGPTRARHADLRARTARARGRDPSGDDRR
jgi:hypothetical protein